MHNQRSFFSHPSLIFFLMNDGFIGEVRLFAGNFAPRSWAFCDGQLLAISANSALFSIIGTTYGGDGRTTFALPDLRGRLAVHAGGSAGPGLEKVPMGAKFGTEATTLNVNQLPSHTHSLTIDMKASDAEANRENPTNNILAKDKGKNTYNKAAANVDMASESLVVTIDSAGGTPPASFDNRQPSLVLRYVICLNGTFPSRS
jgi:microcystin-dependent protein